MSKDNIKTDYYSTSDLGLATVISLSHPLQQIDRQNANKSLFIFKRSNDLEKLVKDYWEGMLEIEPKVYFNQLKTLKTRLYSEE